MLITHVELENFKSYAGARIAFEPGTNAIIGANGAGKSTLLEAIGFALFDHLGTTLASCLREGTEAGRAVVGLVSSYDEREYEVERCFNSRTTTRYRVYDLELGSSVVAEGGEDIRAWLHQHLRVEPSASLDTLFENTVGVPQGTFTAPFLLSTVQRKAVFDPLLQVQEYRKASDNLLDTVHHLADQEASLRTGIANLEGQLAALPSLREEEMSLGQTIVDLEAREERWEAELNDVQASLGELDEAEARVRDASSRLAEARSELSAQERLLASAEEELKGAEASKEQVENTRAGHKAYLEAEARLKDLERVQTERNKLLEQYHHVETGLALVRERLAQLDRDLADIAEATQRMGELRPLVEKQNALEIALRQVEADLRELDHARQRQSMAEEELREVESQLEAERRGLREAEELEEVLARTRTRLDEVTKLEERTRTSHAATLAELESLRERSAALESAEARCPVCEAELTPEHRAELLGRNEQRMEESSREVEALHQTLEARAREAHQLRGDLERGHERLRALPTQEDLQRTKEVVARRRETWEAARAEVAALSDAPSRFEEYQRALGELGDPRQESQRLGGRVGERQAKESEHSEVEARQRELAAQGARLTQELAPFEGLDDAIRTAQAERDTYREAHTTYLAHLRSAEQYEARRAKVEELSAEVRRLGERTTELDGQYQETVAKYDADEHARVRDRASACQRELADVQARLQERCQQLDRVRQQIRAFEAMRAELERQRSALQETEALHELVEKVRELLRTAGPYVTRQLVRQISREASTLYADIMGDHSSRLHWSEDYEVSLEVNGRERTFRQFSGGERMCAALAVRMGLLRKTSDVDVVFLDEPTAHLDPQRRESLAERIMQISGFPQLFVISHDDTFERVAQNYIRIVKDENGSRVERY